MPEVTVVMSVFNGEPYLASALESIVTQSIREFDVLVVNDGSTDRGPAILDAYAGRDSRIKVIHQPNAGIAAAANRGCALVTSPYIARMDADDVSLHNRLERQLHFLRARPDVVLLGGGAEVIDESGNRLFSIDAPTGNDEIKGRASRAERVRAQQRGDPTRRPARRRRLSASVLECIRRLRFVAPP